MKVYPNFRDYEKQEKRDESPKGILKQRAVRNRDWIESYEEEVRELQGLIEQKRRLIKDLYEENVELEEAIAKL